MTPPRYDVAPLIAVVDRLVPSRSEGGRAPGMLGMLGTGFAAKYRRAIKTGWLTTYVADSMAVALGLMPWEVWPTWFEDELDEPRCLWCRMPGPRRLCEGRCYEAHRAEVRRDARMLAAWVAEMDATRARLDAMTSAELRDWLGLDTQQQKAA